MKSAFISYASADKSVAEKICRMLEERGVACWIAPRDIIPGRDYGEEIIRGIEETSVTVLILSENANNSPFVKREVERAVSKSKPVFPVRIRQVSPSPGLELFISSSHWVDAWQAPIDAKMDQLASSIHPLIGISHEQTRTPKSRSAKRNRSLIVGGGVWLVAVAAIYFYFKPEPDIAINKENVPRIVTPQQESLKLGETSIAAPLPPSTPTQTSLPTPAPATPPSPSTEAATVAPASTKIGSSDMSVPDVIKLLNGTTGYSRAQSIGALAKKIQTNLSGADVAKFLADLENNDRRLALSYLLQANRIKNGLTPEEVLLILKGFTGYTWAEAIGDLAKHFQADLSGAGVAVLLADLENSDRRLALSRLLQANRIKNGLAIEEVLLILKGFTGYVRAEALGILAKQIQAELSGTEVAKLLGDLRDSDRRLAISVLVQAKKIKLPMSMTDMDAILLGTTGDTRMSILQLLNR